MSVKEQILSALLGHQGESMSGQALAQELAISRNAVWKAVTALRQEGYPIEAVTNKGYLLKSDAVISDAAILSHYAYKAPIIVHQALASTNDEAKKLAQTGAATGTVVIADHQTAGRGRKGRQFFSPAGTGVYMSVILRPRWTAEQSSMITSCAAVAVAHAIESLLPLAVGIKWVNDLFINGKKTCGILTEAAMDFESGQLDWAVLGIGINAGRMDFPPELDTIATSLENESGEVVSRNALIAAVLEQLDKWLPTVETGAFLEETRRRCTVIGHAVTVSRGEEQYPAKAIGIDDNGGLIIETADGQRVLRSGEVSVHL